MPLLIGRPDTDHPRSSGVWIQCAVARTAVACGEDDIDSRVGQHFCGYINRIIRIVNSRCGKAAVNDADVIRSSAVEQVIESGKDISQIYIARAQPEQSRSCGDARILSVCTNAAAGD